MSDVKKNYIVVKDRHPRISEVQNDCTNFCVPAKKNESLASILQKMCAKITNLESNSVISAPIATGCPPDDEYFIMQGSSGTVRRSWLSIKNCLLDELLGVGILIINGSQLDGSNQYLNTDLINQLVVFYNGINRFLLHDNNNETYPTSEWKYLKDGGGNVVGIQILIPATFTSNDIFIIFPNPNGNP